MQGFRTATGCRHAVSGVSLGHALQDSTECHIKEEPSEVISDAELEQLYTEEAEGEQGGLIDEKESSHLEDPNDIKKEEEDDVETDAEYINLEDVNIKIEENAWEPPNIIGWEPDIAGPSSQSADNICPKIVKVVLKGIDLNGSRVGCFSRSEDLKQNRQAAEKIFIEATSGKLNRNKEGQAEFGELGSLGARVSRKPKIAALEDTEDATANKRKIEVHQNEQTKTVTIKEPKIVTKKTKVVKPVTTSKILETCNKIDINVNKCDNVVTSIVTDICKEKSINNTSLEYNVGSISSRKNKPFSCDTCNKCFTGKYSLKTHIRIHTDEKLYHCNVCRKCFIREDHLKTHIRTHTGEKPYQCNVCMKCFIKKSDLKRHIRTHTGEKPYQCNICNKCFTQKGLLISHIRTHTGEKPYQCNVCNKCFTQKSDLKTHIRTHTGEKLYQCNVCKKCFTHNCHFKTHIRIHTGEKPYQCNVCNKCFSYKYRLKDHIRTHTGEKLYQCNVCNKCFNYKHVLKHHIRTHTGEKPYQCNICNKCFSQSSNYLKHIRIHNR